MSWQRSDRRPRADTSGYIIAWAPRDKNETNSVIVVRGSTHTPETRAWRLLHMKLTWGTLALVATGGLVLTAPIAAQQPATPAQAPPDQPSRGAHVDRAHEG